MASVELENISKSFGKVEAVRGVSLSIADRELVVFVGPSGCGKSTLLRMIAGLEEITSGTLAIGGKPMNKVPAADRGIAMVFQSYALYPHMTVAENMAYGLKNRGIDKAHIEARVQNAAQILQLGQYLPRKPSQLSGGQRQRVAMGRAIVREPACFLFDEPLSNLDAKLRVQMRVEIKKLQQKLGVTSIYVTHDQVEAMTMADRLIVMNGGKAEQIGKPLDLYARPASQFVAGFLGSPAMNFVPATVGSDGASVELAGGLRLAFAGGVAGKAGAPVVLGVRPEHLEVAGEGGLAGTVEVVEALGADTLVHIKLAGGESVIARFDGATQVAIGDQLTLAPNPGDLHLFDSNTGLRLN